MIDLQRPRPLPRCLLCRRPTAGRLVYSDNRAPRDVYAAPMCGRHSLAVARLFDVIAEAPRA